MSVLYTTAAIILDVHDITILDWPWTTPLGFLLFVFFVGWIIFDLHSQNTRLQEAHPSIKVKPISDPTGYYLEVHNYGEAGEFQAQIEIVSNNTEYITVDTNLYSAWWVRSASDKAQIMKGHYDRIKVASFESGPPYRFMHIRRYFYGATTKSLQAADSSTWIVGVDDNSIIKPCFVLRVTISSIPRLKEGPFVKSYELSHKGLREITNGKRNR